jgi:hypothetical protein
MKTLPMLAAATFALSLWGCVHDEAAEEGDKPSMQFLENEVKRAQYDRMDAPTVYMGEATGAPGRAVLTDDGQIWSPEESPGNTVTRTASDVPRSLARDAEEPFGPEMNGNSVVIDEGPTQQAPEQ